MNPFEKYLGKEQHLHIQICRYISAQYPDALFCHPMNEGKRTKYERFLAKILYMKAGIPDIIIFEPKGNYVGLAIELKIRPNNIPTDAQKKWLSDLSYRHWRTEVIYDFETGKKIIDEYMDENARFCIRTKSAKQILHECFLGVIDFNEEAALKAMKEYANQFRQ